jgi:endonuclease YncB( thermonuclease family)
MAGTKVKRPAYRYACSLLRAIDGDTWVMRIDAGFHVHVETHVRLLGWNCPELREPLGLAAKLMAEHLLVTAPQVIIETEKDEQTFGRWLGRIWIGDEELGALLERQGLATRNEG